MITQTLLTQIFNNNFVAYYRSHVAHVNTEGRNFYSDHKLLQKIYESLQDQIDVIAELLRSMEEYMPCDIQDVLNESEISTAILEGDSDFLLEAVMKDLQALKDSYDELEDVAEDEDYEEISNYAQDRVLALNKQIWMLRATLN
jgi:starvation-inducible DNA-binding protein